MLLARDSLHEFQLIKTALDTSFKNKDLGTLKYFLGLEVAHSTLGISPHLKKLRKTLKAEMPRMEQRIQKRERHMNICRSDESWIILKQSYFTTPPLRLRKTLKPELPRMEQRIQKAECHTNICMSDESWIILKGSYARWRFVWVDIGTDRWRLHSQCFPQEALFLKVLNNGQYTVKL